MKWFSHPFCNLLVACVSRVTLTLMRGAKHEEYVAVETMKGVSPVVTTGGGRATLAHVAARAGVSVATASKALNGRDRVSAATRARVAAAAEELSFAPNSQARSLLSGRTRTVGMLIRDSQVERFAVPVMLGAENALGDTELSLILCDARGDEIRVRHYLRQLLSRNVDGILVVGSSTDLQPSLTLPDVPVVYVYGGSTDPTDVSFMPDERGGAELAVEHLVATGRRRIAHVTGPTGYHASRARAAGVATALERAGLQLAGDVFFGQWSQRWGRLAAATLLSSGLDVDAIVCGSDQIASGVADVLIAQGVRVPDDVAITGFDNWLVFAEEARTPLTSVDMNLEALGAQAARALSQAIDGGVLEPGIHREPCQLVIRESTGARLQRSAPSPQAGLLPHFG